MIGVERRHTLSRTYSRLGYWWPQRSCADDRAPHVLVRPYTTHRLYTLGYRCSALIESAGWTCVHLFVGRMASAVFSLRFGHDRHPGGALPRGTQAGEGRPHSGAWALVHSIHRGARPSAGGGGAFEVETAGTSTLALAPALIGMAVGGWVRGRVSEQMFRRCFFLGLLALGAHLASRALI